MMAIGAPARLILLLGEFNPSSLAAADSTPTTLSRGTM
jgi:hypothetical protein